MRKTILTIAIVVALITNSCKEDVVGPDDSNAIAGRRDYTWVADTIGNPYLDFYSIWGNATNNIWTTGVLMSQALYRYDGQKWSLDDRVYISDPMALWGYGNDLWIGNDKGCIWKFTGDTYKQELEDYKVDNNLIDLMAMAGSSNKDIYIVGHNRKNPIIMKYDGSNWSLDKKLTDSGGINQIKYSTRGDKYYLVSDLSDYTTKVYEYNRKELKMIYEHPVSNAGVTISTIDGYVYLVIGEKIYRYFNGKMEFIFEVNDSNFGGVVWGRNRKDIFIRMQDGLAHYNGTDWQYLFKFSEPMSFSPNSAVFGKDFFIPARIRATGYNIIYHGTLKEEE
jgi:hypothetical protein